MMSLERTLLVDNVLDRLQALERQVRELQRLAARPGTGPGQLAYYQADGSLYLGPDHVPVVAVCRTDAGQSIPSGGGMATIVDFEDVILDTHGAVTTGASWQFIAPLAGTYLVVGHIYFAVSTAWAENEIARLRVFINGGSYHVLGERNGFDGSVGSGQTSGVGGAALVPLGAGDTLDLRATQNSGAANALSTNPHFNHVGIFRIQ
jgi:hypothetical protein